MAPPRYTDFGKASRDLFTKGYNYGYFSLGAKTKTDSGVEFTTSGNSCSDTGKSTGEFETKYKCPEYGLTFTEKWNTDNILDTEVIIEDQPVKGLKVAFDTSFTPQTGKKNGRIMTCFKQKYMNLTADMDFDFSDPIVYGAAVFGYKGWLAGYQVLYDTAKSKMARRNFAVGYTTDDISCYTCIGALRTVKLMAPPVSGTTGAIKLAVSNGGQEYAGSIYRRLNPNLETAVNLTWTSSTRTMRLAASFKYGLGKDSSLSVKVNNSRHIGIGYTLKLRDGVKMTLSGLIEGRSFNKGGHKMGLGLELEA